MASALPTSRRSPPRRPAPVERRRWARSSPVPRYSQMVHEGDYPQYDGGGEAWCSPTSTTMVLDYYDALPPAPAYSLGAARTTPTGSSPTSRGMTYDAGFGGTGNWPFNTAYAASRCTGDGGVRDPAAQPARGRAVHRRRHPAGRLVTFASGQLTGAPISSTNGHLLVIVGFREERRRRRQRPGRLDPHGGPADLRPRPVRGRLAQALRLGLVDAAAPAALVYVIHDAAHPLPSRAATSGTGELTRR